jgi:hypothetical protein
LVYNLVILLEVYLLSFLKCVHANNSTDLKYYINIPKKRINIQGHQHLKHHALIYTVVSKRCHTASIVHCTSHSRVISLHHLIMSTLSDFLLRSSSTHPSLSEFQLRPHKTVASSPRRDTSSGCSGRPADTMAAANKYESRDSGKGKGGSSSLGVGRWADNCQHVTKCYTVPHRLGRILRNDQSNTEWRPKKIKWKMWTGFIWLKTRTSTNLLCTW